MIRSFKGEETRLICEGKLIPDFEPLHNEAPKRLRLLEAAASLEDLLQLRSADLKFNKDDQKGQYSLLINVRWRVFFEWPEGAAGPEKVLISHAF